MMPEQLKVQKDMEAEIVIDFGDFKAELVNCRVFSNDNDDIDIVFLAQDPNDPNKKVQVTLRKK